MAKSMTGYGRATSQEESWAITWEIRSLNSRHLDLKWKIPPTLYAQQKSWEDEVKQVASRGGVELFLRLNITDPILQNIHLDTTQASAMFHELHTLAQNLDISFAPDLNRLMAISALWKDTGSIDNVQLVQSLAQTLQHALADWDSSRIQEGQALEGDLRTRFANLGELVEKIKDIAATTAAERFSLLQERVNKLVGETGIQIDEERMLQELAIISDRIDVSEELTRLYIHLESIDNHFQQTGPVGRKLDFMVQECFREINTCGNKSQNSAISQLVVDFKAELEKCREQIQNLE